MRSITPIALLLLIGIATRSQPFPELRFNHLTERDGLSCDKTNGVAQDASGVIWICTNNGLNRFDGFGFTHFFADVGDKTTIPANEIETVTADRHNHLWIQTAGGICRFNSITYKVDRFDSGRNTPPAFRSYQNTNFWFNQDDEAFAVAPTGLYHFDSAGHYTVVDESLPPYVMQQLLFNHYRELVNDRRGGLWADAGNRIYHVDPKTLKCQSSFALPLETSVEGLLFDSANRCWAGTWESGIWEVGSSGPIRQLPGDINKVVLKKGLEWRFNGHRYLVFGTNKPGVLLVDPATGNSHYYLVDDDIRGMGTPFVDRQNTLWVPTGRGVFYVNPSATLFNFIPIRGDVKGYPDTVYTTTPYSMREEKSGYWLARRYMGGMFWFTPDWKLIRDWGKVVDSVGPEFHDGPANIREAYDFKQVGDTMFITTEWGIMLLNLKTMHRTMITDPASPPVMRLRTIVPENDHRWWIRSFSRGVFLFDPVNHRFLRRYLLIPANCNGCGLASVTYLMRDRKGRVLASTDAGMFRYDAAADSFLLVHPTGKLNWGNSLYGDVQDRYGTIWIGTDHGICAYDADSNRILRVLSENNSIGPVERVAIDSAQNVWFRSISGYWCWLRRRDRLIQFRIRDGLPDNEEGLFYTASNGNVYAGATGGVLQFHADQLARYNLHPDVRIMDVYAGEKSLPITTGAGGEKRLTLGPGQHSLQVVFDVINYDMPDNNLFFYKLSSTPGDWTPVDNGRLSFNNLAPGEYTLTVKGGNKLAGLFESTDHLIFTILPYWYQSSWFKCLAGLALLAVILLVVRIRIRHIQREAAFRQKITETELQALRAQMNPHFIFNSLNSIENFIMKNEKWLASDYLNKFARLFRMILHSSRNELVPFSKDMEALQLYVDLERLRYNNKFVYETDVDPQLTEGEFRVPSLLVQPYIENAIVHGLGLSTREDGYVRLSATLHGEYICYRITDNGVGRERAREVRRVNNPNHRSVGLAITENRINIFSHQQNSAGRVSITDLSNEDGTAAGTRVEVMIKAV
jgi:ligand-binding sensor domain-containing protein/anti-sigma regulatory factor (Ser/Thr protein kinase)